MCWRCLQVVFQRGAILLQLHLVFQESESLANIFLIVRVDWTCASGVSSLPGEHFAHVFVILLLASWLVHYNILLRQSIQRLWHLRFGICQYALCS